MSSEVNKQGGASSWSSPGQEPVQSFSHLLPALTLSSPADPGWPGSAGRPPSELAGRSPAPRSPQSPTPAALWSAVPPDIDSSCLSFCPQTRPRLPAAAAPGT
uniref:Uncharacterized protein n=1 Tax=Takifugu rubripes TaxID=31033 RepID=A0A674PA62_TAKRU